jgi:hypothetical protein
MSKRLWILTVLTVLILALAWHVHHRGGWLAQLIPMIHGR